MLPSSSSYNFLTVSCNVELETLNELVALCLIQTHWFILFYEWIFLPTHDFVTSLSVGYLENIGSLTCVDLPNVDILHYTMKKKKITLLLSP